MCTGIELLIAGMTAASSAASLMVSAPKPPDPVVPAAPADAAKDAGAKVNLGVDDAAEQEDGEYSSDGRFITKRKTATTVGGLGRGGMAL